MSDLQTVCNKIRNAKNNLGNAEKSFSNNRKVRGELDLMLAEAELTSLRRKNKRTFNWTRQFMAVCLALLITGAGAFGWWWASSASVSSSGTSVTAERYVPSSQAVDPLAKSTDDSDATKEKPVLATSEKKIDSENMSVARNKESPSDSERVVVSKDKMWQLVRSGKQELSNTF